MNVGKSLSTSAHTVLFKTKTLAIVAVSAFSLLALSSARADTITGPSLTSPDSGWTYTGVGFTANIDSTLTGFTFVNQGHADSVILYDSTGDVLDSIAVPASTPSYTATVNWSLLAGHQYYLIQPGLNNSYFANWGGSLPSDTQITMTDTGIFGNHAPPPPFTYSGNSYWTAINNIQTSAPISATPEPSSWILMLSAIPAMFSVVRRKRLAL
ncbi:MAG: PEP-CTERM sorting domain-containing protein [Acidobacteriota bacterium]